MADITQMLQQMLNAPERSMARIDKQNVATLARILTSSNATSNPPASATSKPTLQIPASILMPQTTGKAQQTSQSTQLQGSGWQWPNPPKALLTQLPAKLSAGTQLQLQISMPSPNKPVVQLIISQSTTNSSVAKPLATPQTQQQGPQSQTTQASQASPATAQVAKVDVPITQLPTKLVKALVDSAQAAQLLKGAGATKAESIQSAVTNNISPAADKSVLNSSGPVQLSRGIAIKQAHQLSPQQFQQALKTLVTQIKAQLSAQPAVAPNNVASPSSKIPELSALLAKINTSANAATTSGTSAANTSSAQTAQTAATLNAALRSPSNAIEQLIKVVLQKQPSGESMQRPDALQRWVSDWFAARPVSAQPSQQMGSLGQMLMTLLGLSLQQSSQQQSNSPSNTPSLPKQFTQALIQQVLNPSPDVAGDVRERINQLLLQLPQQQLQRLLQLFTGVLNSAQSAQARLQDSPIQQPEYFILLPTDPQKNGQNELLIRPEREPDTPEQDGRTLWLFTLRFELDATGPLLVKGRYHPQGSSVDFYAESATAQSTIEKHLEQLEKRLSELDVNSVKFRVQQGKIPETLATQQSGIIRVKV